MLDSPKSPVSLAVSNRQTFDKPSTMIDCSDTVDEYI